MVLLIFSSSDKNAFRKQVLLLAKSMVNSNFTEITLQCGCSPVNLLHIFTITFPKNTSARLLLGLVNEVFIIQKFPRKAELDLWEKHCLINRDKVFKNMDQVICRRTNLRKTAFRKALKVVFDKFYLVRSTWILCPNCSTGQAVPRKI